MTDLSRLDKLASSFILTLVNLKQRRTTFHQQQNINTSFLVGMVDNQLFFKVSFSNFDAIGVTIDIKQFNVVMKLVILYINNISLVLEMCKIMKLY